MVHALKEAQRVLKPNGLLIDLRPGAVHRRVGIMQSNNFVFAGRMHEDLSSDRSADAAIQRMVSSGVFSREARKKIECNRHMDSLDDFRSFIEEFGTLGKPMPADERVIRRIERGLAGTSGRKHVVVTGPLTMTVLRKRASPA